MAIGDYTKTIYVNGQAPALNASNLNKNENKTDELDKALASHMAEEATETELGHIRLSDIAITDITTGEKYRWGVENGRIFLEKVVV